MSSYLPPTEDLSKFNPQVFQSGSTEGITLEEADNRFLKKSGGIMTGSLAVPTITLGGSDIQTQIDDKAPINDPTFTGTVSGINKNMVGLTNVDNTSDVNKPVSTAQQTALNLKAPIDAPTFTGTVSGISKNMVGLGNVDNTSDADKPVSTATTTQLNLKAPLNAPTFTGTVSGISKNMVGLGNVDNTSDANKPVSTAQQTALNLKAPLNAPTFTGTVSGISKNMVGLGNVDNTSDADKPVSTATTTQLNLKAPLNAPTFTGTVSGISKNMVGLGNVDNTSDADKPVSTATTTQLNLKAPLNAPTFTGTVSGISKNMVGLGNVDNTSDADKPVSTAQQTALNGKQATINNQSDLIVSQIGFFSNAFKITTAPSQLALYGTNVNGIGFYIDANDSIGDEVMQITSSGNVKLKDGHKMELGTNTDLQIYHDGNNSFIKENGTGVLAIDTNGDRILMRSTTGGNKTMGRFNQGGSVELYHNGNLKLQTTSSGITVTGTVVDDSDLRIKSDIVDADRTTLIEDFEKIRFCNFYKTNQTNSIRYLGVIAQELMDIYPNAVIEEDNILENGEIDEDLPRIYFVKYQVLYLKSCMVVQELIKENNELKERMNDLEERLTNIENQI